MRIVFMGTPDFSVPTLKSLISSRHQLVAVVTQPDKPKGRGNTLSMPPVKEEAMLHQIPVYQPPKAREKAFIDEMRALKPDVMVVIAFGQILSKELLEVPTYGCVNIHGSLLPKYRGAAPIQWAVINGDEQTGLTTMMMDVGMDTGDMLEKLIIPLDPKETGGSLFERLSLLGGQLILSTLDKLEDGSLIPTPQNHPEATHVKKISKSMGDMDWTMDAVVLERLIRGLNPWPSAYTHWNGRMIKIWDADVVAEDPAGIPGQVIKTTDQQLLVKTGKGCLKINSLQLEGKKRMDTPAFLRGYPIENGCLLERSHD